MPLTQFGPWIEYGPTSFRAARDAYFATPGLPAAPSGWGATTGSGAGARSAIYRMYQSSDAFVANQLPYEYADARECAFMHAKEGESGIVHGWDPGECEPLGPVNSELSTSGSGFVQWTTMEMETFVGAISRGDPPALFTPADLAVDVYFTRGGLRRSMAQGVPWEIICAVPGALADIAAGRYPQAEALNVDGRVRVRVDDVQTHLTDATTVRVHAFGGTVGNQFEPVTPYSQLGAVLTSCSATPGSVSSWVEVPGLAMGAEHVWDLSSSWVETATDPGEMRNNRVEAVWEHDSIWTYRLRWPDDSIVNVLRWRQRGDGYGMTAARRNRTPDSQQATMRHRAYR